MCSFELQSIDVAKILRKLEGGNYCTFCYIVPSIATINSEQDQIDVPQKNTFSIQNQDL